MDCEICAVHGIVTESTTETHEIHCDGYRVVDDAAHYYCDDCLDVVREYSCDPVISALRTEAGIAGDMEQVDICTRALSRDSAAIAACVRVIDEARAQIDSVAAATGREPAGGADEMTTKTRPRAAGGADMIKITVVDSDSTGAAISEGMTLRQCLEALREAARSADYRAVGGYVDLSDGTRLHPGNTQANDQSYLLGCYDAARIDADGKRIARYRLR